MDIDNYNDSDNDTEVDDTAQHNYTSFIPVPCQEQTEMEAVQSNLRVRLEKLSMCLRRIFVQNWMN